MLYQAYQLQSDMTSPLRMFAEHASAVLGASKGGWPGAQSPFSGLSAPSSKFAAACEVLARLRLTHARPAYNLPSVEVARQSVAITEHKVCSLPSP